MRLFIAINLPEDLKTYLRELQGKLPKDHLVLTHDFHLTLFFLGSVMPDRAEKVKEVLRNIRGEPFSLRFSRIGHFGSGRWIRVVWVGIEEEPKFITLQRDVEQALIPLGFEKENRPFHPHLTLARVKGPVVESFQEAIRKFSIEKHTFPVQSFELMKSHLSPKGARYEIVETFRW